MTDFRALCTELLGALHYARAHKEFPETFDELEARAAAAIAEPPEPKLPLVEFNEQGKQQPLPPQQLPADASKLVRYQEAVKRARAQQEQLRKRVPGAHWY